MEHVKREREFMQNALNEFEKDLISRNFEISDIPTRNLDFSNVPPEFWWTKIRPKGFYVMEIDGNVSYFSRELTEIKFHKIVKFKNIQQIMKIFLIKNEENGNISYEYDRHEPLFFKTVDELVQFMITNFELKSKNLVMKQLFHSIFF